MHKIVLFFLFTLFTFFSCKTTGDKGETVHAETITPVTVTSIQTGRMDEVVELNATSVFQIKSSIKSPVNGYLQEVNARLGENVRKGQRLFVIRSKEAENLANTISKLDTTFRFRGTVRISAPGNGYVTQLSYQPGDYVQDGETLATISNLNSLVFILDLPYSLKPFLSNNKTVVLTLSDGQKLRGTLSSGMPVVDPVAQTQNFMIRVSSAALIPENLIAKVAFIKHSKPNAIYLPKDAVLTNEVQSEFWIMKMENDSIAIKTPVKKGIESNDRIEILSPALQATDRILLTGNYGLPDTAKVVIEKNAK